MVGSVEMNVAVYKALAYAHGPLTRREIATRAGYAKSPSLIRVVEEIVKSGEAIRSERAYRHVHQYVYVLRPEVANQVRSDLERFEVEL